MHRFRYLTKSLQSPAGVLSCVELQTAACPITAAARLFSSAASSMDFTSGSQISSISGLSRPASFALPQQQLTSMLSFSPARSFSSSGDSDEFTNTVDAATSASIFDPSAVLDAVLGAEEDGWVGAREDVWFFNRYMQSVLRFAQATTGLPWWETIAISTLCFRIMTIPFHLQSVRNTYNMTKAKPEVERLAAQLRQEQENKNPKAMEEYQRKLAGIWKRNNCHPVKSVLPILIQAPVFIGFFSSLQSLARAKIPSLMEGGTAWFTDLTVSDTTMVLPFMAFGVFLLSAELGGADGMQGQPPHVIQRFKWAMRILTAVMIPFAKDLPASVFIYWVTSNTWSFIQSMVLKQTPVKRYLGFPINNPKPGSNPTLTAVQPLGHAAGGRPIQTFATRPPLQSKDKRKNR